MVEDTCVNPGKHVRLFFRGAWIGLVEGEVQGRIIVRFVVLSKRIGVIFKA